NSLERLPLEGSRIEIKVLLHDGELSLSPGTSECMDWHTSLRVRVLFYPMLSHASTTRARLLCAWMRCFGPRQNEKAGPHGPALLHSCSFALPYDIDARTRSGVNGTRRMRTPVASKIAFAIAAVSGRIEGSPAPDGGTFGRSISTMSIRAGVSVMSRIG